MTYIVGDNCIKCLQDALVAQGVIEKDDKSIVRGFSFRWDPSVKGCRVEIRSASEGCKVEAGRGG